MPRRALAFLPTSCEVCRSWSGDALCAACRARFAPAVTRCLRCGLRLGMSSSSCGDCLRRPPPWQRAVVAFGYAFPWDRLIAAFKFEGRPELAAALAAALADAIREARTGDALPAVDAIAPVPLARARLAERGYNQAWELARRLASTLRLPAHAQALQRTLDTPHQAGLTRVERERNLRAAFAPTAHARAMLAGRQVALVDDVLTTGATAREATAALQRAGAASVQLWVLARTPEPSGGRAATAG
jgi:ComF family protein